MLIHVDPTEDRVVCTVSMYSVYYVWYVEYVWNEFELSSTFRN